MGILRPPSLSTKVRAGLRMTGDAPIIKQFPWVPSFFHSHSPFSSRILHFFLERTKKTSNRIFSAPIRKTEVCVPAEPRCDIFPDGIVWPQGRMEHDIMKAGINPLLLGQMNAGLTTGVSAYTFTEGGGPLIAADGYVHSPELWNEMSVYPEVPKFPRVGPAIARMRPAIAWTLFSPIGVLVERVKALTVKKETVVDALQEDLNDLACRRQVSEVNQQYQKFVLHKLSTGQLKNMHRKILEVRELLEQTEHYIQRFGEKKWTIQQSRNLRQLGLTLAGRADDILKSMIESFDHLYSRLLEAWLTECRASTIVTALSLGGLDTRDILLRRAGLYLVAADLYRGTRFDGLADESEWMMNRLLVQAFVYGDKPLNESGEPSAKFTDEEMKLFTRCNIPDKFVRRILEEDPDWRILHELRTFMPRRLTADGVRAYLNARRTLPLSVSRDRSLPYPFGLKPVIGDTFFEKPMEALRADSRFRKFFPDELGRFISSGGQQKVFEGREGEVIKFSTPGIAERMTVTQRFLEAYDIPHFRIRTEKDAVELAREGITIQQRLPDSAIWLGKIMIGRELWGPNIERIRKYLTEELKIEGRALDSMVTEIMGMFNITFYINSDPILKREALIRGYLITSIRDPGYEETSFLDPKHFNIYMVPEGMYFHGRIAHWFLVDW